MPDKKVIIIAGPNGAGKTTFALEYLPNEADCPVFVNADLIAAGLSPFRPTTAAMRAGRLMLEEINAHAREGRSFAFETTLAGRGYVKNDQVSGALMGYTWSRLIFLSLPTPEEAISSCSHCASGKADTISPNKCHTSPFQQPALRNFHETVYRLCVDDWLWYQQQR